MRRRRDALAAVAVLLLAGCVNTRAAIAPATLDDLTLGIAADVESWFTMILMFVGV